MNTNLTIPEDNRITSFTFEAFEIGLSKAMQRAKLSFFEIGYWLYHANDKYGFLSQNGYNNITEYAYEKFGLSKSATYDLIKVYRRFRDETGLSLDPNYHHLNQSQLIALSRMKYTQKDFLSIVKATDTVSDIEKAVKIYNSSNYTRPHKKYSNISEYIALKEKQENDRKIIYSRHLEKNKADEIINSIHTVKRTYGYMLEQIQKAHVWTQEIRSIYMQIESNFAKLERAIQNETKEEHDPKDQ